MRTVCAIVLAACGGGSSKKPGAASDEAPAAVVEDIHFIGRFDAMHRFAWPGSAIATRFSGTQIAVDLADAGMNWFEVTIDGVVGTPLQPTANRATYMLASGLADGAHDLVLARRTETSFGTTTFYAFPGATLIATPRPPRLIEFIGDSITCGYGVLGATATCPFTPATEAETHAWAAFASSAVAASHVAIAY